MGTASLWQVRQPLYTHAAGRSRHYATQLARQSAPEWIARYVAAYEQILDLWSERFPGWLVDVDYAQLVTDPERQIPRLLQRCALADDPATRRPHESPRAVATSSFAQVREPMHAGRVGAAQAFPVATRALRAALDVRGLAPRH